MTSPVTDATTHFLSVDGGRIAYDVRGSGPLLILLPGMGELRSSYRHLAPRLVAAGYTVATADLRGHGDSDATFASYGDAETAGDTAALVRHLGGTAILIGNSMSAGAAVIVAARHPDLVRGLVLVGPFVRNPVSTSRVQQLLFRVMMARPWAAAMWNAYLPTLYSGRKPDDFAAYRRQVRDALGRPGYARAFSLTTRTSHAEAERALTGVNVPALVIMGAEDPDFPEPAAEAEWVRAALGGTSVLIEDAGHYPQAQQDEQTANAIISFLTGVEPRA